jgi:hypothetical protein
VMAAGKSGSWRAFVEAVESDWLFFVYFDEESGQFQERSKRRFGIRVGLQCWEDFPVSLSRTQSVGFLKDFRKGRGEPTTQRGCAIHVDDQWFLMYFWSSKRLDCWKPPIDWGTRTIPFVSWHQVSCGQGRWEGRFLRRKNRCD